MIKKAINFFVTEPRLNIKQKFNIKNHSPFFDWVFYFLTFFFIQIILFIGMFFLLAIMKTFPYPPIQIACIIVLIFFGIIMLSVFFYVMFKILKEEVNHHKKVWKDASDTIRNRYYK